MGSRFEDELKRVYSKNGECGSSNGRETEDPRKLLLALLRIKPQDVCNNGDFHEPNSNGSTSSIILPEDVVIGHEIRHSKRFTPRLAEPIVIHVKKRK